ncbi:MAG: heparinase II/III family protein [Betaproteobacteria bacterium]|nr:heparinase II/III family protein [Betaproteobacteria bacterium]
MGAMRSRYTSVLWYFIPLLVFSSIWVPEFSHYYVPGARIADDVVMQSRATPSDSVLQELEEMRLAGMAGFRSDRELIAAAQHLLKGELKLPNSVPWKFAVPFSATDLTTASSQLQFASLIIPSILLDAYGLTGRQEFFALARGVITGLAEHERAAWLPEGFLWDDHATAARIPVLIKFWRLYRMRTDFDPGVARIVLQLLARSGQLLAKPSHYTFRTNHGVMQNLGLLHLCIAFPEIPGARGWCKTALDRFTEQMRFFVNVEGVVLEHSAGYHAFGMELLGMISRCLTLMDRPIPSDWRDKYWKARAYYGDLRRPDGTLPMYGDTGSNASIPLVTAPDGAGRTAALQRARDWRPDRSFGLFPIAGHAISWRGLEKWPEPHDLAQTVATWANFPGHGHKLADELSVVLWSGGQTWVTNSGYWPYGHWGREHAEGWEGANAPHLLGEPKNSVRTAELLGFADDGRVTVLDLRRQSPAGYSARRQLVQLGSELWVVLDQIQDSTPRRSITLWTVDPALAIVEEPFENAFRLKSRGSGATMSAHFLASAGTEIKTFRGSRQPFAGWVVSEGTPTPATAFRIEQPSGNSWALALWVPEKRDGAATVSAPPEMLEWISGDRWKLSIPMHTGNVVLQRMGGEVILQEGAQTKDTVRITLAGAPDVSAERAVIRSAFEAAEVQFGKRHRDLYRYRLKISYLLLAILAIQEIIFLLLRKIMGRYQLALRVALSSAWLIMGAWIVFVYLES